MAKKKRKNLLKLMLRDRYHFFAVDAERRGNKTKLTKNPGGEAAVDQVYSKHSRLDIRMF